MVEYPTEEVYNRFMEVDLMGSWMEIGIAMSALIVGFCMGYPLFRSWIKKKRVNKTNPCSNNFRNIHSRIHEFLTEIRVKMNADRSCVLQFHNGGSFLDGSSMKKFSLTHESCSVGVQESMTGRYDLLASAYVEMLDRMSKDVLEVEATSNLPDCNFKRHLESNHTLVFAIAPIRDSRGVLISGFLLLEWCTWDSADMIDDDRIPIDIKEYSRYIESRLSEEKKI
tara:strand:- start:5672 stop:6346 length:675 start_codon:yes stop_codon:yes gene_type:complete